ncbi:hypothetical protein [Aquibacillus koreensis]|uniref:hypothetical protein n=1 Tax=Aquibacillus koreensis TaxID=279446 RepID=UPI00233F930A|nr:hypothetical protein [Aquibacillus koreensis]
MNNTYNIYFDNYTYKYTFLFIKIQEKVIVFVRKKKAEFVIPLYNRSGWELIDWMGTFPSSFYFL